MSSKQLQKQKSAIRMEKMQEAAFGDDQVSEFKEAFEMFQLCLLFLYLSINVNHVAKGHGIFCHTNHKGTGSVVLFTD